MIAKFIHRLRILRLIRAAVWSMGVLFLWVGAPAWAQTSDDEARADAGEADMELDADLDRIVVTAQFREQAPIEVPIAVTAYDQSFLDDTGLDQLDSLSSFVPGLLVQEQSVNNPGFVIRGIISYKYAADGYASHRSQEFGRVSVPGHELVTLDDYRLRHAQYKSDPDSIAMHAAHPLIAVWDDHEVANDAWLNGAENHQPEQEGEWTLRRRNAWRAYDEWMPTRTPGLADNGRLFRSFDFGDLASLTMLDTRYFGRDLQVDALKHMDDPDALERLRRDPDRNLLGEEQSAWLARTLAESSGNQRWQIIGQQILVNELLLPDLSGVLDLELTRQRLGEDRTDAVLAAGGKGLPMLWDTWDGYDAARQRFLNELDSNAASAVILTGDIHTSIAGDVTAAGGKRPTAVELVTTSISSPGFDAYLPPREPGGLARAFRETNPALHWFETRKRGWLRVDLTPERVEARWRHVDWVDQRAAPVREARRLASAHRESGGLGLKSF